jgi:hypothetical protein
MVRRISLGMTTRPRSSMRRTIPVAFILDSSHISPARGGQKFSMLWKTWLVSADIGKVCRKRPGFVSLSAGTAGEMTRRVFSSPRLVFFPFPRYNENIFHIYKENDFG